MLGGNGIGLLSVALVAYGALLAVMFVGQRSMLYFPTRAAPALPANAPADMREVTTETADGLDLAHWYAPPPDGEAPVVIVFHGNAGDRGDRLDKLTTFAGAGFGVLLAEYRGYGGNPGRPSEEGLIADGRSVLDWLQGQGIDPGRIVLYGESLGTGVAVALAAERRVGAIVLEAPFTSIAALAQRHYWYTPARWLVLDRFDTLSRIGSVGAPVLVLHGERDRTTPADQGRRIYAAAPEPKDALFAEDAGHVDLFDHGAGARAVGFIRRHVAAPAPAG